MEKKLFVGFKQKPIYLHPCNSHAYNPSRALEFVTLLDDMKNTSREKVTFTHFSVFCPLVRLLLHRIRNGAQNNCSFPKLNIENLSGICRITRSRNYQLKYFMEQFCYHTCKSVYHIRWIRFNKVSKLNWDCFVFTLFLSLLLVQKTCATL